MPNLPTSLILVLLAVAWLVVLVPMFARSREAVPETDDSAAGFRVLRHAGARLRPARRGHRDEGSRDEKLTEDDMADRDDVDSDDNLVAELVDQHDDFDDDDDDERDADVDDLDTDAAVPGRADADTSDARRQRVLVRAGAGSSPYRGANDDREADHAAAADYDGAPHAGAVTQARPEEPAGWHQMDAADEWVSEHQPPAVTSHARPTGSRPAGAESAEPAPTDRQLPHRAGRGGFDPAHAAAAAAYRFRRRRFVTLIFLLLTLGLTAGAVLIMPSLAIGAVVCGLVMVGYLFYLSRQVRIERAISERRMARLRRAREIRPATVRQAAPISPYQQQDRQAGSATPGPAEPLAGRSSQLPPDHRPGHTTVDLDDDDPAFDDLEKFEPIVYRRAAGQ